MSLRRCLSAPLLLALTAPVWAQGGGALDPAFGTGGRVVTNLSPGFDFATALAALPDGALLAAGTATPTFGLPKASLVRYTSAGVPDATFGTDGVVTLDFGAAPAQFTGVAVLRDGSVLAAGNVRRSSNSYVLFLARFSAAGVPDAGFGTGGIVETALTGRQRVEIAEGADGAVLVGGAFGRVVPFQSERTSVARFTANGTLDAAFGTGGVAAWTALGGGSVGLRVDAEGRPLVASLTGSSSNYDIQVLRFTPDGKLDASYGTGGEARVDVRLGGGASTDGAAGLALDAQGRAVVVGRAFVGGGANVGVVLRLTPAGRIDSTFATGGIATVDAALGGPDGLSGVAVLPDGRIVAGGTSRTAAGFDDFLLVRLTADGALDPAFDGDGIVTTDLSNGGTDEGQAFLVDPQGRFVIGGYAGSAEFALARYLPTTGVATEPSRGVSGLSLSVWPNPSRGATTVSVDLDVPGAVRVAVYDALGRTVALLHDGWLGAGEQRWTWTEAAATGAYVVRLETPRGTASRPLVRLR